MPALGFGQIAGIEGLEQASMSRGTMLPTTEITPRPPMANSGSVRLSSPLSTVRFVSARICEAWSIEPVASLTIDDRPAARPCGRWSRARCSCRSGPECCNANRNVDRFGQRLEVLIEAFLGRLVVIGSDDQRGVGAGLGGLFGQAHGLARAVGAGAGHHLDAAGGQLADVGDDPLVLVVRERGDFAGGADGADAVRPGLDLKFD